MRLVTRKQPEHRHLRVHWHVTIAYPALERGSEERVFGDLHLALDSANAARRSLVNVAHESSTEVTEGRDRVEGVIRRYYVSDEDGAAFAIIEVCTCLDETHR